MGSMISEMHESKTQIFVNALNRVPMRVIWRFSGKLPKNVGNNIKVMDWFPQNDLMGHENTKLFISHGGMNAKIPPEFSIFIFSGTNGLYEAIYHGVPILGLPIVVDQFDNMQRITGRGAGRTLDISNLTEDKLYENIMM